MTIVWRARCEHRDVRLVRDDCPPWSACSTVGCRATWVRYEVTESVVWRVYWLGGSASVWYTDEAKARGERALRAPARLVKQTNRSLRRVKP